MKLNKILVGLMVCAFLVSFMGTAFSQDVTITGTVEKADEGYVIKTADGDFKVAGADVAAMVEKNVKATGTVVDKTITVTAVEEVK